MRGYKQFRRHKPVTAWSRSELCSYKQHHTTSQRYRNVRKSTTINNFLVQPQQSIHIAHRGHEIGELQHESRRRLCSRSE